MFDVGITELGVIGLVALIVIGPEQLPRVARTAGHLMGRLRRYVADVKTDITREMELADLQRIHDEVKGPARSLGILRFANRSPDIESDVHHSIGISGAHQLADATVTEATPTSGDMFAAQPTHADAAPVEAQAAEVLVDPNQMDLFGAPAGTSELPEKH